MAHLFMDSFDHYASGDITQKWSNAATVTIVTGRNGNGAQVTGSMDRSLTAGDATFIVGFAYKPASVAERNILTLGDGGLGSGETQLIVRAIGDGSIKVFRNSIVGTLLGQTAVSVYSSGVQYFEFKAVIGNTGSFELRINNVTVLSATGVDTQHTAAAQWTVFRVEGVGGSPGYVDDLYVNDGTGSLNNTFWGDTRIDCVFPDANGAHSDWTRSTGANQYATIDETSMNGDTDYNSTATVNAIDTVGVGDTPAPDNTIRAVQQVASVKKTDSGTATIALVARQDGVDYVGATEAPGTAYGCIRKVYDRAPDTTPWTPTIFNAMEFGYKRIA